MNDPSVTILTTVARCRVRMQLVAAARRAGITIPLAIVAVELFAVTSAAASGQLAAIAGGALALAVAIAALPSILRVPGVRTSAAAIDARLGLQDRTVTAVQMLDDPDPMARLVVRDAATRLSMVSPGRVFPFEAPGHFRSALAGALGATVLFVVMTAVRGQRAAPPDGSDGIRQRVRRSQDGWANRHRVHRLPKAQLPRQLRRNRRPRQTPRCARRHADRPREREKRHGRADAGARRQRASTRRCRSVDAGT